LGQGINNLLGRLRAHNLRIRFKHLHKTAVEDFIVSNAGGSLNPFVGLDQEASAALKFAAKAAQAMICRTVAGLLRCTTGDRRMPFGAVFSCAFYKRTRACGSFTL
jgi:hypothetical protein